MFQPRRSAPRDADRLIALGRAFLEGRKGQSFPETLLPLAVEEGMEGILAAASGRVELAFEVAERNRRLFALLSKLSDFELMLLKGSAMIVSCYRRLDLRPLSDLDLLVSPERLEALKRRLYALGLRPQGPSCFVKRDLVVDLHLDLLGSDRFRHRQYAFQLKPALFWQEGLSWRGQLMFPSPELLLIHTAIHALKHSYERLIWGVDLALLFRQVSRERLLELAQRTATLRPVAIAAAFLERLGFGRFGDFKLNPLERRFVNQIAARKIPLWGELFWVASVPSWRGRFNYLIELCWPKPHIFEGETEKPLWLRRIERWLRLARSALWG